MSRDDLRGAFDETHSVPSADVVFPSASKLVGIPRRNRAPDNALIPVEGGYRLFDCLITPIGITFTEELTEDQWVTLGRYLLDIDSALSWALADWLAFGENREWGKTYEAFAEEFGLKVDTLYDYAWVARRISIRNRDLSFAHHRLVAGKSPEDQAYWLSRAVENRWSVKTMRAEMNPKPPTLSGVVGKFSQFLSGNRHKHQRFARQFKKIGQGERLQIAQMIDDQIAELEALKRNLEE